MTKPMFSGALPVFLFMTAAAGQMPWHDGLSLADHGYWPTRVAVNITNSSTEPVSGEPLGFSIPSLAGMRIEAIRVCRRDGVELLFDVRDGHGPAKREGAWRADDKLIVPVECPAQTATTLWVYAGNSDAWPVPDFLPETFTKGTAEPGAFRLTVSIGEVERLQLKPAPPLKPKKGSGWQDWAEVRVRRFGEEGASAPLVRVNVREALARFPGIREDCTVRVAAGDGTERSSYSLGRRAGLLFAANLPPSAEQLFQVGFQRGVRLERTAILEQYERLLSATANLAPNGSFEIVNDGPDHWRKPAPDSARGVSAGFSTDARFGKRALELTVRQNTNAGWLGWYSGEIPVKPGATYLLSGWLKAVQLQSWATLHAHFHDTRGSLTRSGAMVGTQPTVSGNTEWVNSMGFFQAPPDAASVQLHLTMNTHGTLRHDGIILCEVVDGELISIHSAAENSAGSGLRVWEVNPLVKVFPETPPGPQVRAVSVELARNEYQAFQVALKGASAKTTDVAIAVSPLKGRSGAELPAVRVERVGYVPIDCPSAYYSTDVPEWCRKVPRGSAATDGWAGWWPDPLAPVSSLQLSAKQTQPIWFTVHAPTGATPGRYQADVTITAAGDKAVKVPLTVDVLPFTIPERGRLAAIFDLRFGPGGSFDGADSTEQYRKWLRFVAEHRLGIDAIRPPPEFSYKDGKVSMDATKFDETARYCFDQLGMNVAYTPHFFYMFGWAYPPKKLFGLDPFTPEWTSALQQSYRLFAEHLRQKGWHDKFVYYISDEPHFQHEFVVDQMKKLCAVLHEVDPAIPIYSSTWRHCAAWDDSLDLWGIGQHGSFPVNEMERLQRAGKKMWFTCDGQMATDTPYLATERLLPYYCFRYGVSGFEFWGLAWWTYDPWQIGWHQFIRQSDEGKKYYWIRYPNGDGFLAYPGKVVGIDGPVSTIRLEQIRQGLQDYEALVLLADLAAKAKQAGRPSQAAEKALGMARDLVSIPNAGGLRSTEILPDPDRMPVVRKAVNAALVQLLR